MTAQDGDEAGGGGCFLCDNPRRNDDRAVYILHRGRHVYALLNLYPYNSGHILVAPYAHGGEITALERDVGHELWELTQQCAAVLKAEYNPDGFNIGMNLGELAGAGVPDHLHVHVVPRWGGDTNFMPVLGRTKVLPEDLEQTYARLARRFPSADP